MHTICIAGNKRRSWRKQPSDIVEKEDTELDRMYTPRVLTNQGRPSVHCLIWSHSITNRDRTSVGFISCSVTSDRTRFHINVSCKTYGHYCKVGLLVCGAIFVALAYGLFDLNTS
eukprot:294223_1